MREKDAQGSMALEIGKRPASWAYGVVGVDGGEKRNSKCSSMTEIKWSAAVSQGSQFVATGNFVQTTSFSFP